MYYKLKSGLFVGSYPDRPVKQVDAVLNVSRTLHDLVAPGVVNYNQPVNHLEPQGEDELFNAIVWMHHQYYALGRRVLVHCRLGQDRSFAVVTAYLWWSTKLPLSVAIAQVESARPASVPSARPDIYTFLTNTCTPAFFDKLHHFGGR